MAEYLSHLQRYYEEEYVFLSRIVTGDETYCHHFEPESKRQSQQWKHLNYPPPKKSKAVHTSTGIMLMTFFFDCRGPLLVDLLERGATINAKRYADRLKKLLRAIKSKCTGMLSDGIIILHNKACPHATNPVRDKLQRFGWETLQHSPYSSYLSPCNFHIFGDLEKDIRGRRFHSDEEVQ